MGRDPAARADGHATVVVIGAGPAGAALGALLARRGIDVALVERDTFPRDKLCGEFLSPEAGRLLRDIGCHAALAALRPPPLTAARFTLPSGFALEVPLPGVAWGLSRRALDATLAAEARAAGARLHTGTAAVAIAPAADGGLDVVVAPSGGGSTADRRVIAAGLVVGAYGRWNRLDRTPDRTARARPTRFVGLKRHLAVAPGPAGAATAAALAGRVELHLFDGGYCGLTVVETGAVNACLLVDRRRVAAGGDAPWAAVLAAAGRANPVLGARLAGLVAPADSVVHAVAPVTFDAADRGGPLCLYVGDAAGMIAPLAGDGQAMALDGAARLAALVAAALARTGPRPDAAQRRELARAWDRTWRRAFGRRMRLARALQPVLLDPRRAEPAARLAAALPGAAAWLARATRG